MRLGRGRWRLEIGVLQCCGSARVRVRVEGYKTDDRVAYMDEMHHPPASFCLLDSCSLPCDLLNDQLTTHADPEVLRSRTGESIGARYIHVVRGWRISRCDYAVCTFVLQQPHPCVPRSEKWSSGSGSRLPVRHLETGTCMTSIYHFSTEVNGCNGLC